MAGLPPVAGGPGGDADPLAAELGDNVLAGVAGQGQGQNVGRVRRAHKTQIRYGPQLLPGVGLAGLHAGPALLQARQPQLHGPGESGDLGRGLGARPQPPLLAAAKEQGQGVFRPAADVQRAGALGPPHLVGGDDRVVRAQSSGRKGDLQKALDRVGVEQGRPVPEQGGDLLHREPCAGLVVHQHHAHQGRVLPQGRSHLLRRDPAVRAGAQIGGRAALPLQLLHALEHPAVLYGGGDDVAAHPAVLVQSRPDGPVVPLRAAGGEEKLLRPAPQGPGDHRPVPVQPLPGGPAGLVLGGGVGEVLRHHLHHGLGGLGGDGGGGGVIQVVHRNSPTRNFPCPGAGNVI